MQQVVRTLTAADDGLLVQHRVLICDRDTKWSAPVRARLGEAGIRVVQTPYRAPNANAYAERFVRSINEECLDRVIPLGERHFRRAIARVRRALSSRAESSGDRERTDRGRATATSAVGRIRRRPRLGGSAQLLRSRGVMTRKDGFDGSADERDTTGSSGLQFLGWEGVLREKTHAFDAGLQAAYRSLPIPAGVMDCLYGQVGSSLLETGLERRHQLIPDNLFG